MFDLPPPLRSENEKNAIFCSTCGGKLYEKLSGRYDAITGKKTYTITCECIERELRLDNIDFYTTIIMAFALTSLAIGTMVLLLIKDM